MDTVISTGYAAVAGRLLMGNASILTTLKTYTHVMDNRPTTLPTEWPSWPASQTPETRGKQRARWRRKNRL